MSKNPQSRSAGRRTATALVALALAAAQTIVARSAVAQDTATAPVGIASLLARIIPDGACAQQQVIGQCYCGAVPCGLRIRRYVPVAIVETTRAPGDTVLGLPVPGGAPIGPTASSALSTTDNTAEAHVWSLPDGPIPGLACLGCGPSAARVPAIAADTTAARCGPANTVAQATQSFAGGVTAPWLPQLDYASETDAFNWRTGCRDLSAARFPARQQWAACPGPMGPALSASDENCLGAWGPLRPRQMRDIGPPPLLYAAKTAVRAMSIARDQIGSFPFPVDTAGKLQQAYPAVSACFRVGALPLPQVPDTAQPVRTSADGRYAWIYWRQASCCIGFPAARQCLMQR